MEHDQDRIYEEEALEDNGVRLAADNEVDDLKYFQRLMLQLRTMIEEGGSVPFSKKVLVDADKFMRVFNAIDENLPDAIQCGLQLYQERDRLNQQSESDASRRLATAQVRADKLIKNAEEKAERRLADAEEEARAILEDARDRADHMIMQSEIVRQAKEEARILRNEANVAAGEMRLQASHDAAEQFSVVEEFLESALKEMTRRRSELKDFD